MKTDRGIRVCCPACDVLYRLGDAALLPIARCGRCYGAVVPEREAADASSSAPAGMEAAAA